MANRYWKYTLFLTMLGASIACLGSPALARFGILEGVHGYDTGHGVVVPLRGVAEWMGATVEFNAPQISITLGSQKITMRLGSRTATVNGRTVPMATPAKDYGGITCVPVRAVGEALGCQVQYLSSTSATEYLNYINHVVLTRGNSTAIVLVHGVPPDVVGGIVTAARANHPGEVLGNDYLLRVSKVVNGWASTWEPWWFDDQKGFSFKGASNIYQRTGGHWVHRYSTTRVSVSADDLRSWGVPASVVRSLGWEIE